MCGIVGFTHLDERVDPDLIRTAVLTLVHRGPDRQATYASEHISLGAVRLSIIDLEGGDQPMVSADGDTVVAFNGEIYNHAEVRRELESRGHRFRTRCDTEVVLEAFLEWDTACFERLRGMFGVALWSESRRRLVLGRDRLGIKPLYIHQSGRDLRFGSELKALFCLPEVDRELDPEGLDHYLSLNYVPSPHTLIRGIRKLPPGHWLEWQSGRVRTGAYWQLRIEPRPRLTLESAMEELDGLMRESLREHLIADVGLGVWASGGLDSSAVLHYAAEAAGRRLKTFSVSFQGRSFDESSHFRRLAEHYGTEHHELDLNPELGLAEAIQELAYFSDEPSADAGALPVWYLSKMTREHVTVALSGEGADEVFGGYVTYRADRIARQLRRIPAPLRRLAQSCARRLPVSDEKIGFEYKLNRLLDGLALSEEAAHCYWGGTFSQEQKQALLHNRRAGSPEKLYRGAPQDGLLGRMLWFDQMYYLPDDILYKCDRMSMAHSLEVRPPFLDHRIVEFAATLPDHLKIRGREQKLVLRRLMRGKLPPQILARGKQGFDIPAHDWLRGPLRELLLETLTAESLAATGCLRPEAVLKLVRAHLDRRVNLGFHLWGLLILCLWMRRWRVQPAARTMRPDVTAPVTAFTNS